MILANWNGSKEGPRCPSSGDLRTLVCSQQYLGDGADTLVHGHSIQSGRATLRRLGWPGWAAHRKSLCLEKELRKQAELSAWCSSIHLLTPNLPMEREREKNLSNEPVGKPVKVWIVSKHKGKGVSKLRPTYKKRFRYIYLDFHWQRKISHTATRPHKTTKFSLNISSFQTGPSNLSSP